MGTKSRHKPSKFKPQQVFNLKVRPTMKKARILILLLLFVFLVGCTAPSNGDSAPNSIPPTDPPASEKLSTPDLPDEPDTNESDLPDEIEIVFEIEGTKETMTLQKYTGKNFFVYVDEANFTAEESEREVNFLLTKPDLKTYPDVSMTIGYEQDASIKERQEDLSADESYTYEGEREIGENTALWFHAKPETNARWDSPTQDIYLIEAQGGFFTITVSGYLEASEGWGARMFAMIGTFLTA